MLRQSNQYKSEAQLYKRHNELLRQSAKNASLNLGTPTAARRQVTLTGSPLGGGSSTDLTAVPLLEKQYVPSLCGPPSSCGVALLDGRVPLGPLFFSFFSKELAHPCPDDAPGTGRQSRNWSRSRQRIRSCSPLWRPNKRVALIPQSVWRVSISRLWRR